MFDVCIVGGGMVGSALACGLQQQNLKIALIEQHLPQSFNPEQPPDLRMSAFSMASVKLLESLGAWPDVVNKRVCEYKRLSVWENTDAATHFDAADIGAERLGYFIENRLVQLGLHEQINRANGVSWYTGTSIKSTDTCEQSGVQINQIALEDGQTLQARLVVGADGGQSRVREILGIGTQGWQYQQQAMGIIVKTDQPAQDITWQQFAPTGPMAFLPMYNGYASFIWYHQPDNIGQLNAMSASQLKQAIVDAFPAMTFDFEVLKWARFPLTRMHANRYVQGTNVLLGDAAHTINPLAGQGVNIGFKDVACLLEQIAKLPDMADTQALNMALKQYQQRRRPQNLLMMSAMDTLYTVFSNRFTPLEKIRNLGLKVAEKSGPLKHQVMKYAMGIE